MIAISEMQIIIDIFFKIIKGRMGIEYSMDMETTEGLSNVHFYYFSPLQFLKSSSWASKLPNRRAFFQSLQAPDRLFW